MIELNAPAYRLRVRSQGDDGAWQVEAEDTAFAASVRETLRYLDAQPLPAGDYYPDHRVPVLQQLRDDWLHGQGTIHATPMEPLPESVQ